MRVDPEIYKNIQYENITLRRRVAALESGDAYARLKEEKRLQHVRYEWRIDELEDKNHQLEKQLVENRNNWFKVFQDVEDNCESRISKARKTTAAVLAENSRLQGEIKKIKLQLAGKIRENVDLRAENIDLKEQIQNLKAQKNEGFENSSIPSSMDMFRPAIPNNRIKTGRKPGAQPGHKGHPRRIQEVTEKPVLIEADESIKNDPDYYIESDPNEPDGLRKIRKQVVGIHVMLNVREYYAYEYRRRSTGGRYHAPFPDNVRLETNFDESIKAFIFELKNHLNVSEEKIQDFFLDLTNGRLQISRGFINGINREFAGKSNQELEEIFATLERSDVMYTDMTTARRNGKMKNVTVCSNKIEVMYNFGDKKGFEGVKGTPVEHFTGALSHDGDKTFLHFGSEHQRCNVHMLRYLEGASGVETKYTWHKQMQALLREMNKTREAQDRILTREQINDYDQRYDEVLQLAAKEYNDDPPSKYYRKGINLFNDFKNNKSHFLYFLEHPEVDFSNNEAERQCRVARRKLSVSGGFRGNSNRSGEDYCKSLSVAQTIRRRGRDFHKSIKAIFERKPVSQKKAAKAPANTVPG